ncbi:MAG: ABC transporter substrate-binding protein [Deltaproteobacteria bacterium]|nr:ABC transporter substrate-binding protein [Deltaproteobacteria bacterium]
MKTILRIFFFLGAILIPALNLWAGEVALKKATFIPQWVPQAQFAGYYVALEKGIYKRHGIDLTILTGGPGRASADLLRDRKADFATIWLSTGIQMRSEGIKVLNIAQMVQRSALMLVTKKKSGIRQPIDMNKKKIGLWGKEFQVQPKAFFKKYNLDVKIIRQSYSVNLFLRDGVDVASAMWYNEYHTILNAGINENELVPFFFHDHGLNFPEDGIYTLEDTFVKDPELCKAFVRASIEGWKYAFVNPEEALAIVLKNLQKEHLPAQRVHQTWMLDKMKKLTTPHGNLTSIGKLYPADFVLVVDVLKNNGLIENPPRYGDFYRRCYWND